MQKCKLKYQCIAESIKVYNIEADENDLECSIKYNERICGYEIIMRIDIEDFIHGLFEYENE